MEKIKKKKSSGLDEIGQDFLLFGAEIIAIPLTRIINNWMENGAFPNEWKRAVVTPILKKEDQRDKANCRPVSCLAAALKVLEKIICK